jgi:thioredoxin reductase (NADPH)
MPEVIIVGAGPAGLAVALQLKRYGIDVLVLEKSLIGGLLNNANLVENYLGFPGGIPGEQLISLFSQQVKELGVEIKPEKVLSVHYENGQFQFITPRSIFTSNIAIIATGTKPKLISDLEIPERLHERVLYEILPIKQVGGKRIGIIGGGDLAFDYALNLARKNRVTILNRGAKWKCLPLLWERANNSSHIRYLDGIKVTRIVESPHKRLLLDYTVGDKHGELECDYLLIAIGREPQLDFFSNLDLDIFRELETLGKLYFIGDVKNGIYRQAAIAAGEGIMTAMKINSLLNEGS